MICFTEDEVELFRQWGSCVQDVNPKYLTPADYALLAKVTRAAGMRVPDGVAAMHKKGTAAWADVPDATVWVDRLRGGEDVQP